MNRRPPPGGAPPPLRFSPCEASDDQRPGPRCTRRLRTDDLAGLAERGQLSHVTAPPPAGRPPAQPGAPKALGSCPHRRDSASARNATTALRQLGRLRLQL